MRLRRLELKAFGPFTDRTLEFDSREPGLHVIFGTNEAGKSSSLRALKALLYGFDQRSPDNFLHHYHQLLVGGCLENRDGQRLSFYRRKKRLGDLVDQRGEVLPADALQPFLHGVDAELFETLYGIDHDTLVSGGEDILARRGEVGQALFAAAAGLSSLGAVLEVLDQEASDLFKATGQHPPLNQAIKRYKELQREFRLAGLSLKQWQESRKALEQAKAERGRLEEERDRLARELRRLDRLAQAIPELASHETYRSRLRELGEVAMLPPDFAERYHQADLAVRQAALQLAKDGERCRMLEARRGSLAVNRALLKQADRVNDLYQRLGAFRKGMSDRPEREGMRISLRRQAARLLQQVRPGLSIDNLEPLREVLARKNAVQRLSEQYSLLQQQHSQAEQRLASAGQEDRQAKDQLAALAGIPETGPLQQALKVAHKCGEIDELIAKHRQELAQATLAWRAELQRLGRWSGELRSLLELPLPLTETVQLFDRRFAELADARRLLAKEREEIDRQLAAIESESYKLNSAGEIPSEEELFRIREQRQRGWRLLCRQWLDREDVGDLSRAYAPDRSLIEAYEDYVRQADDLADRLRREADRVAESAALHCRAASQQDRLTGLDRRRLELDRQEELVADSWQKAWQAAAIEPLEPKEMAGWLAAAETLRYKAGEIIRKEDQLEKELQQRRAVRQNLEQELRPLQPGEMPAVDRLGPVVLLAETVLETIARRRTEREKLGDRLAAAEKTIDLARSELAAADKALIKWQEQWQAATAGLGLPDDLAPFEVLARFDLLQDCFNRLGEADDLQKRIDGIDRDARILEQEVRLLLSELAPEALAMPVDQAILRLRASLDQAHKLSSQHAQLSEQIAALEIELAEGQKGLQAAKARMDECCRLAGSSQPEEVAQVIARFGEYRRWSEKIADAEANLARIGAGIGLEELVRQAATVAASELPEMNDKLQRDSERLHPEINRISQTIGELETGLRAMDGRANAADLKERMEAELARIRRLADRYTVVKLASGLLQQAIERYREEHQDPVLKIASDYFARMTLHSFAGLCADLDDRGQPVLVGLRPDQVRVMVAGMSAGTRDQLYLALRLATLQYRLAAHEPMPFIVDDILVNFDDQRSRATLELIAELATRNQVLLFTHHRQVAEEALRLQAKGPVLVHPL